MDGLRPTHALVDLDALARNFHAIGRRLPAGCAVMPVVKADGYGHGAADVARRLEREGARAFAVAVAEEGAELRRAGISGEILVMGWIGRDQLPDLLRFGLTPNAHGLELLADLADFARGHGVRLPVHLKLDTGMTRLGLRPEEMGAAAELLARTPELTVTGAFQNFASADDVSSAQTSGQMRVYAHGIRALAERGIRPPCLHVSNSAGTLLPPDWPPDLPPPARVRPGLILYTRFAGLDGHDHGDVMSLVSVVAQAKRVPPGTRVGYGGTFVTERESVIAIVPAGYADGIPRSLAGGGVVLVAGRRCPIAGRISMDLTAVDVTGLPSVPPRGEEVVFFGTSGGERLGAEEMARAAGTVAWEILCGVGPRVPRIILERGAPTRVSSRFFPSGEATVNAPS